MNLQILIKSQMRCVLSDPIGAPDTGDVAGSETPSEVREVGGGAECQPSS